MVFKAAKCPNCGGELQLPDNRETVKCMYCGGEVVVQKAIRDYAPQVNIDNLLELADKALEAGNFSEAYTYYSKVLEVEPKNYKAWFGKGRATCWLGDVNSLNIEEALKYFHNSLDNAPEDYFEELSSIIGKEINNICMAVLKLTLREIPENMSYGSVYPLKQRLKELTIYFIEAMSLSPNEILIYENAVFNIKASVEFNQNDQYYIEINQVIKKIIEKALENNPNLDISQYEGLSEINPLDYQFKSSLPEEKSLFPCYIATAVYGDFNAPQVLTLRHYRDEALMKTKLGRLFVRYYYTLSPSVVRWMKGKIKINQFVKRILDQVVQTIESRHGL